MRSEIMQTKRRPHEVQQLERRFLRGLCSLANFREASAYCRQLSQYGWLDPDHRIVFDAIRQLRVTDTDRWQAGLPALATRMGFPEIDWGDYFGASRVTSADLQKWIAELSAMQSRSG